LRFADLVITIGTSHDEGLPAVMLQDYGVPADRLLSVPNGVDLDTVRPAESYEDAHRFTIFYVGSVATQNGIAVLLEALDRLRCHVPEVQLVIAGEMVAAERERYRREFCARGESVEYLGPTHPKEVHHRISHAHVCLYPFLRTPVTDCVYPVKVCEYLALGKPVVASRLSGVMQIVHDGENGLLVEPGNAEELSDALYRLFADPGLRHRLSRHARDSVMDFDWTRINPRIGERVDAVMGGQLA
jgi:glycosyltransferase involved in cell wall biosynthesis